MKSPESWEDAATQVGNGIGQAVELPVGKSLYHQLNPDQNEKNGNGKNYRINVQLELLA